MTQGEMLRIRLTPLAALLAVLALAAPASAAALTLRPAGDESPLGNELLSNERTLTRWAFPFNAAPIRSLPRSGAHVLGRLHYHTEDGPPEVYLALRSHVDSAGHAWIQTRIP